MKATVIEEMSTEEIKERVGSETNMLIKLKMNHAVSPLENPLKIKYMRKTVARLLTELRKRELTETENGKEDKKVENIEAKRTKEPEKTKIESSETLNVSVGGKTQNT